MPSYKVGARGEGLVSGLLDFVQRKQAKQEAQDEEFRKFRYEMQKAVLERPDVSPDYLNAILTGQPTTGLKPITSTTINPANLTPGQTFTQKVAGGTLTTQGGYAFPTDLPTLSRNATDQQRQDFLSRLSPEDQDVVQGLADYTLDPSKTSSLFRGNQRQRLLALTKRYNPDFDMKSFTAAQHYVNPDSGVGRNITSLNTLVGHLGYLKNSVDQLQSSGQPLANAVILTARNITGDPTITDYDTASEVVNSEVQRALTAVGVTQQGMERQGAIIPRRKFGEQQAQQYIRSLSHILETRLGALETGYRQQIKRDPGSLITYPETRQVLDSIVGITRPGGVGASQGALIDRALAGDEAAISELRRMGVL